MNKYIGTILFIFLQFSIYSQVNFQDSTVQIVAYWMSGETQNYEVNSLSYKIVENDTLDLEKVTYSATISILDSTQNSYLFAWTINDFNLFNVISCELFADKCFRSYQVLHLSSIYQN